MVELTDRNDPRGAARRMSSRWRVGHRIVCGARRKNGQNMIITPEALAEGDFVEVSIALDITVVRSKKQRGTVVRFSPQEVVRLWTAEEAQVSANSNGTFGANATDEGGTDRPYILGLTSRAQTRLRCPSEGRCRPGLR